MESTPNPYDYIPPSQTPVPELEDRISDGQGIPLRKGSTQGRSIEHVVPSVEKDRDPIELQAERTFKKPESPKTPRGFGRSIRDSRILRAQQVQAAIARRVSDARRITLPSGNYDSLIAKEDLNDKFEEGKK